MVAASGLFVTAQQVELSRKVAKAEFMREFYSSLQQYNDLQLKLIEGGEWRIGNAAAGPQTEEDWFRLQRYMGLLEQLAVWYRDGIVDIELIDFGYSHRIKAIATHPLVKQRLLLGEHFRWKQFLYLVAELEEEPEYRTLKYSHPAEAPTNILR